METAISIYNPDTRMQKIKTQDKLMWVTAMITRMYDMAGQKAEKENLKLLVRELIRDLESRYRLLALEEVETIIGNGVRGDFGEYYGLSVASIAKWFKTYMDSGAHNEYLASKVKELKLMLPESTGLTDGEVEKIMISGCIRCFNEFVNSGKFNDYGRGNYYFLKRRGLIKLSEDQIKKYLAAAKKEYKENLETQKLSTNKDDAKDAIIILKNFLQVNDRNANVQSIAQYNAMADFFKAIIKRKQSIEYLINATK